MDKPKPLQVRLDPNPLFALVDLVNFAKRLHEKLAEQVAASIERHAHILGPHLMPRIQNDGQVGSHRRDGHEWRRG